MKRHTGETHNHKGLGHQTEGDTDLNAQNDNEGGGNTRGTQLTHIRTDGTGRKAKMKH